MNHRECRTSSGRSTRRSWHPRQHRAHGRGTIPVYTAGAGPRSTSTRGTAPGGADRPRRQAHLPRPGHAGGSTRSCASSSPWTVLCASWRRSSSPWCGTSVFLPPPWRAARARGRRGRARTGPEDLGHRRAGVQARHAARLRPQLLRRPAPVRQDHPCGITDAGVMSPARRPESHRPGERCGTYGAGAHRTVVRSCVPFEPEFPAPPPRLAPAPGAAGTVS
ncbi:hypothetical protein QJS66_05125 [Kocuria rhizophila]|nr:hypothetical protein QJS66_05125 [Kocuria rhizophila]